MVKPQSLKNSLKNRQIAADVLERVIVDKVFLDQAIESLASDDINIAYVKRLVRTTLKHDGQLDHILQQYLTKPIPNKARTAHFILLIAACEMVILQEAPYAIVDAAVSMAKANQKIRHMSGLMNAVLRKVSQNTHDIGSKKAGRTNTPDWLASRLDQDYGVEHADAIMNAHLETALVDLSTKTPLEGVEGVAVTPYTFRLNHGVLFSELPEYQQGLFWVQDAASALPVQLLGDVKGQTCLDIAAAPGGKTMQLVHAGAEVTALDISQNRLRVLEQNLKRTQMQATIVCADALSWDSQELFDCVILDAPCSATGTLRRNPDLMFMYNATSFKKHLQELVELQRQMLEKAWTWVKPGGRMLYATCSLLKVEGEAQMDWFLKQHRDASVLPQKDIPFASDGFLRTTPAELADQGGMDGFFAVSLTKRA
jgi:16S rRNA (cytosine967-C5)-methyltransferase